MNYISHIKQDNKSGARELEESARRAISDFISKPYSKESLLNFLKELKSAKPEMAPITILTNNISNKVKNLKNTNLINKYIKYLLAAPSINWEVLTKNASNIMHKKKTILTYSYSSTVLEVLTRLKTNNFIVFIPESRPVFEGRQMAIKLQKAGLRVKFITEAGISRIIREVDIVLLGADSISKKFVVNKTGTLVIALLAKEFKIPCYVISGKNKFLENNILTDRNPDLRDYSVCPTLKEKPKDPKEIWDIKNINKSRVARIEIINYYFESVPIKYFSGIITD
jgi:translation initiation factor 2B subunit (eIF-2B alpha/beta/delta family)